MKSVKRVARNSFITIGSKAFSLIGSLFTLAIIARYLRPDLFGEYIFVTAFIAAFEVFTDMGYNSILVREIARAKDQSQRIIGTAIFSKFVIALVTFMIIFISAQVLAAVIHLSPEAKTAIYILGFAVCMDFFADIVISTARAHERMEYEAIITTFNSLITLLFVIIVTFLDLGFINLFWARLYSVALTMGLSLFIYRLRFGKLQIRQDTSIRKYLTKEALPLGIGQVIERFYTRTNFILIRILKSVTEVGFYGGAYRVVEQLSLIAVSIVNAVFPVFSILSQSSRSSLALAHEKTFKALTIISFPLVVTMGLLSKQITSLVFGARLAEIALPLMVLAPAVFLSFSNLLFKFTLNALHKQTLYRRNVLISFFVNLTAALLLIPSYGYMGACIAVLFSSCLLFLLGHYSVCKYLPGISVGFVLIKPGISSLIMAFVFIVLKNVHVLIIIPCGLLAYSAILIVLKTFTSDEIGMLRKSPVSIQEEYSKGGTKNA